MNLFDVYPLYNITPVKALDCTITDEKGIEYLDLYGGHGVISIGHTQPHYVAKLKYLAEESFRSIQNVKSQFPDVLNESHGNPCQTDFDISCVNGMTFFA